MSPRRLLLPLLAVALAACQPAVTPSPSVELRPVRLLLGFRPDVQFAPFYLAQRDGTFAKYGLEVSIEYKSGDDIARLVADGQAELGVMDATDVMIGRTAGIPIRYVATLYRLFPVALIGPKGSVPTDPADLAGKTIGTPGEFGSSWHALLALLDAGGLTREDVTIRTYPQFNQVDGLLNGDVDLITGFRNNEPLRLAAQGMETDLLTIDEIAPLPGPGVVVGDELFASDPALYNGFVNAMIETIAQIAPDPQLGMDAAVAEVPSIASDRETALAVLTATIELWTLPDGGASPQLDVEIWASAYETMRRLGFIDGSVPLDEMALLDPGAEVPPSP
jgi:NitT/TauT family transport system substrate-binding protein